MKLRSYHLISYVFTFLLQEGSSDVDKGQWSFSFPKSIKVLKNSDVTIPCTFTAPINHSAVNVIWFKHKYVGYPQVFNSEDPSQVIEEYRGRTSLVANGTDSCTLRIKDVRRTEWFYPGISREINSYNLNDKQNVHIKVTGCSEDDSCWKWTFRFPRKVNALRGSCVEIPCTLTHPQDAEDFNLIWYSNWKIIFSNKTPSDVIDEYKGRTFLTGNTKNDCSLKIINVEKSEEYFPGINEDINSVTHHGRKIEVTVEENPQKPAITGTENMENKKTFNISCSVDHSCPSNPATITWNITGHPIMESHKDQRVLGEWKMESIMTYTASYTDDKTILGCAATFPNNKTYINIIKLNITYRPRNTIISVEGNKNTQEGDNVTLICSSQANPPVKNYSWYQTGQGKILLHTRGGEIFVKNTTTGKYICVATNEIGTEESSVFTFSKQSENEKVILYAGIGTAVGLTFLLIVLFCIFRRKTKTSVSDVMSTEKTVQQLVQEEIPMNDHLYGNVDQQQKVVPRQSDSELQDSSHIYNNADAEQSKNIEKKTEEQSADSDQVFYSVLELSTPGQEIQLPSTSMQTEYATLEY